MRVPGQPVSFDEKKPNSLTHAVNGFLGLRRKTPLTTRHNPSDCRLILVRTRDERSEFDIRLARHLRTGPHRSNGIDRARGRSPAAGGPKPRAVVCLHRGPCRLALRPSLPPDPRGPRPCFVRAVFFGSPRPPPRPPLPPPTLFSSLARS